MLRNFTKNVIIYGIASGINKSLNFVFVPIFSRVFTEAEYGMIDLVTTLILFATLASMLQMEAAIGRFFYEPKDDGEQQKNLSTALWTVIFVALVFGLVLSLTAGTMSSLLFGSKDYAYLLLIAALLLPISNLYTFFVALFRYLEEPVQFGLFTIGQVAVTFIVTLYFIFRTEQGIVGVFYGQIAGFLMAGLVMCYLLMRKGLIGWKWSKIVLKKYLHFSLPLLPSVMFSWANSYANRIFMVSYLTLADIGLYTVAIKIASLLKLVEEGIKMNWSPFVYKNLARPDHKKIFRRVIQYLGGATAVFVVLLILLSPIIIKVLLPQNYHTIQPILVLLFITFGIGLMTQVVLIGPAITKQTRYTSYVSGISAAINIGSLFLFIQWYGLMGVAISFLLGTVFQFVLGWAVSERLYPVCFVRE